MAEVLAPAAAGEPDGEKQSEKKPTSDRRREANKRNAQKSTGPRTPEGKKKASGNAITHGIFADVGVMEGELKETYLKMKEDFFRTEDPDEGMEAAFLEMFVLHLWRLGRAMRFETKLLEALTDPEKGGTKDPIGMFTRFAKSDPLGLAHRYLVTAESQMYRARLSFKKEKKRRLKEIDEAADEDAQDVGAQQRSDEQRGKEKN